MPTITYDCKESKRLRFNHSCNYIRALLLPNVILRRAI
jgi:hypothetical protein